eukprot:snap_masked-scaffold_10-processed-gene-12.29-mRNA-1 protein AED:1.00 eAED:1.00 QI:0/0/0/0/1/1/6/0/130
MNSIRQQYEERKDKTKFTIEEHDDYQNPINRNKFYTEIIDFIKVFQPDQEVTFLSFLYCSIDALKYNILIILLCFPALKQLDFYKCAFSDTNFKGLKILKSLALKSLKFKSCKIPEVISFCSFLKSTSII